MLCRCKTILLGKVRCLHIHGHQRSNWSGKNQVGLGYKQSNCYCTFHWDMFYIHRLALHLDTDPQSRSCTRPCPSLGHVFLANRPNTLNMLCVQEGTFQGCNSSNFRQGCSLAQCTQPQMNQYGTRCTHLDSTQKLSLGLARLLLSCYTDC